MMMRNETKIEDKVNRMAGCLAGQFCGDAYGLSRNYPVVIDKKTTKGYNYSHNGG